MADQQFLASFGVDIDESGVNRLQRILAENRTMADSLAASFDAASESVKAFREQVATDFPTLFSGSGYGRVTENPFGEYAGLKIGLNMTEPRKEMASFTENAKKPIPLSANASAIISAARTASENVRSLFSETFTLNVRANAEHQGAFRSPPETPSAGMSNNDSAFLRMSSGGRFSKPTDVQVAEDGDAEYIIPVKKENRALPLLRQLLSELSPEARQSLTEDEKGTIIETKAEGGEKNDRKAPLSLSSVNAAEAETDQPLSAQSVPIPVISNDSEGSFTSPLPPVRETLSEETAPVVSVQVPTPELSIPAPVPAPAVENEPPPAPTAAIPDLHQIIEEVDRPPVPVPAPTADKEPVPVPTAVIPDLHQIIEEVDRPPVPVPAPTAEKEPAVAPTAVIPDLHQIIEEVDRPPVPAPVLAAEKEPVPAAAIPDLRQILSEEDRQLAPVQTVPAIEKEQDELSSPVLVPAPAAEKEQAQTAAAAVPDLRQILEEEDRPLAPVQTVPAMEKKQDELSSPVPVPLPATEKEPTPIPVPLPAAEKEPVQTPAAPIPDLRQVFAEADRPLAPAPAVEKEALPSVSDSPKQNLSVLVSQLSAALRPSAGSVTNTSNNLSAPVTINVNANGSDADRIGQSIYDTAERYLLRTMKIAW